MEPKIRKLVFLAASAVFILSLTAILPLPGLAYRDSFIQQDATGSVTPTESATLTPTQTATQPPSASSTQSATATVGPASTQTPTQTIAQSPSATLTPVVSITTGIPTSSDTPALTQQFPTSTLINSVTVLPFPSFTLQFPHATDTPVLLNAQRQPDSTALAKGEPPSRFSRLYRLWPLILLLIIWLFLATWFVIVQRQMD